MTARRAKQWLAAVGTKPLFIKPGSPWENGYCYLMTGLDLTTSPVSDIYLTQIELDSEPHGLDAPLEGRDVLPAEFLDLAKE